MAALQNKKIKRGAWQQQIPLQLYALFLFIFPLSLSQSTPWWSRRRGRKGQEEEQPMNIREEALDNYARSNFIFGLFGKRSRTYRNWREWELLK
jgi:hypothetical protein